MKYYEASRTIQAPAAKVWEVLTDSQSYTTWDSGIVRVEGTAEPGSTLKIYSTVSPNRAFPVKVTMPEPGKTMIWTGGIPVPGLFKGVRTFMLMESSGMTQFKMREEFTGLMVPLMWKRMPDLQPTFDQFADGLKTKAEATTAAS